LLDATDVTRPDCDIFVAPGFKGAGPGTYAYPGAGARFGYSVFHAFGGATDAGYCADDLTLTPASATLTLTEVSASRVVGSFDLVFGGGATSADADAGGTHLTGTFTAPWCAGPDGGGTCS
jgi:hypothetical protein